MPEKIELEIVFKLTKWDVFRIWFWDLLNNQKRVDRIIEKSIVIE